MKKRLVWIFVILIISLFVISACEQYVGRKVSNINLQDNQNAEILSLGEENNEVAPERIVFREDIIMYVGSLGNNRRGSSGEYVKLNFKDKANNDVERVKIFGWHWLNVYHGETSAPPWGRLILGDDDVDSPLILKEETIYPENYFRDSLSEVSPVFLYYKEGYSYFIKIPFIAYDNRVNNDYIEFRILNTGERFELPYEEGEVNEYDLNGLLPSPFSLVIDEEDNGIGYPVKSITFIDINDEEDGISKIETLGGAVLRLDYSETRLTYQKIFFKERNGEEIGALVSWEPYALTLELSSLITAGDSNFEIHPTEWEGGKPIRFRGITEYGTIIDWVNFNEYWIYQEDPPIGPRVNQKLEFSHPYSL